MNVAYADGGAKAVLTFADAAIDGAYGELLCTVMRRDWARVVLANHVQTHDTFAIEVAVKAGHDPVAVFEDACRARLRQYIALRGAVCDALNAAPP